MIDLPLVLVDFETRSQAILGKSKKVQGVSMPGVGGRRYAEHPTTEVLCAAWRWIDGDDTPCVWSPFRTMQAWSGTRDRPPPWAAQPGEFVAVAHNAYTFDRHIWTQLGWPEPLRWRDTFSLARVGGYPFGGLDALCRSILNRTKDLAGSELTKSLSTMRGRGANRRLPDLTADVIDRVCRYCVQDVVDLSDLWPYLEIFADVDLEGIEELDLRINDRGFPFDARLADTGLTVHTHLAGAACAAAGVTPTQVRSHVQFRALLAARGVVVPNTQADTLERAGLDVHPDPQVRALYAARVAVASIVPGKLRSALARICPDGRLRDTLKYFGAHTGRWSGVAFQPQNLSVGCTSDDVEAFEKAVAADGGASLTDTQIRRAQVAGDVDGFLADLYAGDVAGIDSDVMASIVRACFYAPPGQRIVSVDLAGVEARANAWAANDVDAVALFVAGKDPYARLAADIFNVDPGQCVKGDLGDVTKDMRQVGKRGELGMGYGMGGPKFVQNAIKYGVNWNDVPIDPALEWPRAAKQAARHGMPDFMVPWVAKAIVCVDAYRNLHAPIVQFWYDLEDAAIAAFGGATLQVGPVVWFPIEADVIGCQLPSGRVLFYREVHAGVGDRGGVQLSYATKEGRKHLYGGLLCENVIQAHCRDLLARAMLEADRRRFEIVLTVHDEINALVSEAEADARLAELRAVMCDVPEWSAGMPIDAAGFVSSRFKK